MRNGQHEKTASNYVTAAMFRKARQRVRECNLSIFLKYCLDRASLMFQTFAAVFCLSFATVKSGHNCRSTDVNYELDDLIFKGGVIRGER